METPANNRPQGLSLARLLPLLILGAGLVAFFALGLNKYLTLDLIRENREALKVWVYENKTEAVLLFIGSYIVVAAFSLPIGDADVVVANFNGNSLSVLLGNGDGTLQSAVNYATGGGPNGIVIGDFDADTGRGALLLEDRNGDPHLVSGEDLGVYLKDELRTLRLVFLNACKTATTSARSGRDPFAGRSGLPGVAHVVAVASAVAVASTTVSP